jgi:hypothetical protein
MTAPSRIHPWGCRSVAACEPKSAAVSDYLQVLDNAGVTLREACLLYLRVPVSVSQGQSSMAACSQRCTAAGLRRGATRARWHSTPGAASRYRCVGVSLTCVAARALLGELQPTRALSRKRTLNGETLVRNHLLGLETKRSWSYSLRGTDTRVSVARDAESGSLIDSAGERRTEQPAGRVAAHPRCAPVALPLLRGGVAARLQRLGRAIHDRRGRSTTRRIEFVIVRAATA